MEANFNWPGWEKIRKIGSGSFGNVYEIHRDTFGITEKAALKVLSIPHKPEEIEDYRAQGYSDADITELYSQCLQQIVQEYSLMTQIKGHPNVVSCDDAKYIPHEDGIGWDIYIKMELLTPLMKALDRVNNEAEVVKLGRDICSALVRCKDRSIIHRDIKPQNIFVSDDGDYKLGDFGIAKTVERTTGGTRIGTYKYMAPEVYNNFPYGAAADIYSLGLVLYWLLNEKRTPFLPMPPQIATVSDEEKSGLRRFRGEPIPAPKYGSPELKRIVLKACAYASADRYTSAADMLHDLQAMQNPSTQPLAETVVPAPIAEIAIPEQDGAAVMGIPEANPVAKRSGTAGLWVAFAAVLVATVAIVAVMLLGGHNQAEQAPKYGSIAESIQAKNPDAMYIFLDYGYVKIVDAQGQELPHITRTVYNKNVQAFEIKPGTSFTLSPITRQGYDFLGWYNSDNEKITDVNVDDQTVSFEVYARWEGQMSTVRYYANGGTVAQGATAIDVATQNGANLKFPQDPTRAGYTFVGWFNQPAGGVQFTEEDLKNDVDMVVLYAHWQPVG